MEPSNDGYSGMITRNIQCRKERHPMYWIFIQIIVTNQINSTIPFPRNIPPTKERHPKSYEALVQDLELEPG